MPEAVSTYGFTNKELIESLYAELGLNNILTDVTGTDETNVIDQFIRDAEQTIYVRLSSFYEATSMVGNDWVESRTTWIAAFLISKRRGNEHYFHELYEQAIAEINAMATGEIPPLPDIPFRADSQPSMSNLIIDERFRTAKIRVRQEISVGGRHTNQDVAYGFFWGWV